MAYTHDQLDSKAERDRVNEAMRASDLWRNAITGMGLNPDGALKLSKTQQQQLAATLGLPTSDFHIDPAGNINDFHGWKGLPTAAKIAIAAGAAVATAGAGGMFTGAPGAFGIGTGAGGAASAVSGIDATIAGMGTGGVSAAETGALVAGGGAAAKKAGFWSKLGGFIGGPVGSQLIDTGGKLIAGKVQTDAANHAADVQAQSLKEALDFEKKVYGDDQAFFAPYATLGTGSVARLSDMMGQPRTPVTADSLMSSGRVTSPISLAAMRPVGLGQTPAAAAVRPGTPGTGPVDPSTLGGSLANDQRGAPMPDGTPSLSDMTRPGVSTSMPVTGGTGPLVKIQAPDGEIRELPEAMANAFIQRGAKRVA